MLQGRFLKYINHFRIKVSVVVLWTLGVKAGAGKNAAKKLYV
jgi:hypothetical protein